MLGLCKEIQGCVFGYTQSDEITLILIDYQNINTEAWFDYNVQKLCGITASMATMLFNNHFTNLIEDVYEEGEISQKQYHIYRRQIWLCLISEHLIYRKLRFVIC